MYGEICCDIFIAYRGKNVTTIFVTFLLPTGKKNITIVVTFSSPIGKKYVTTIFHIYIHDVILFLKGILYVEIFCDIFVTYIRKMSQQFLHTYITVKSCDIIILIF